MFLQDRTNEVEIWNNFNGPAKCGYPFHYHKGLVYNLWKEINHKYIINYLQSDTAVMTTSSSLLNPYDFCQCHVPQGKIFRHKTLHIARFERGTIARTIFGLHRNFTRRTAEFMIGFRQVMPQV